MALRALIFLLVSLLVVGSQASHLISPPPPPRVPAVSPVKAPVKPSYPPTPVKVRAPPPPIKVLTPPTNPPPPVQSRTPPPPIRTPPPPVRARAPPPPVKVIPPPPPPAVVKRPPSKVQPPVSLSACHGLCVTRCGKSKRKKYCMRSCKTCCKRCKCVPLGTHGHFETCPKCYREQRTRGNKHKCP